jgi:hypothetical protein
METCNVTAGITAAVTAGWPVEKFNKGLHPRPPMDLLFFMRQNVACQQIYASLDPKKKYPMNEYMEILAVGLREYFGCKGIRCVYAEEKVCIHNHLIAGDGLVIHGDFVFTRADGSEVMSGHFESLAGFSTGGSGVVLTWLVDDPFGDPTTKYKSQFGDNIVLTIPQVNSMIKPFGVGGKDVIIVPKYSA